MLDDIDHHTDDITTTEENDPRPQPVPKPTTLDLEPVDIQVQDPPEQALDDPDDLDKGIPFAQWVREAPGYESPTEDDLICKPHRPRTQRDSTVPAPPSVRNLSGKTLTWTTLLSMSSRCHLSTSSHLNEEKIHFLTTRPQGGHLPGGKARYRNYCAATDVAASIRPGGKTDDFRRDLNYGRFVFNDPHLHSLHTY